MDIHGLNKRENAKDNDTELNVCNVLTQSYTLHILIYLALRVNYHKGNHK